jgi:hypothetical protein
MRYLSGYTAEMAGKGQGRGSDPLFCQLKNRRRIATRYDRLAADYPSAVALVVALIAWI